jgi:DASS family divalent anion:Na+ symporter
MPTPVDPHADSVRPVSRRWRLVALLALYVIVGHLLPAPPGVSAAGQRVTAIFLATIAGLMIQPLPGAAVVLLGITMLVIAGGLPLKDALAGYSSASAWLVLGAMLISRTLRDTGLSRRIALGFVRRFGGTSLGVSYALILSDVTLAGGIPSITARSGGIILPIARGVAELYDSHPGPSARILGTFLMATLYQASVIACAMFLTGQASNVLAASMAGSIANVSVTWSSWFLAGLVPGVVSLAVVPYLVYRTLPPDLTHTPAAAEYARTQLIALGPLGRDERITLAVFIGVCGLWVTSAWHGLDVTLVAMLGISVLLVTGVLTWETAIAERSAWDVFVWYGGLITLGDVLNKTGSTAAFAAWVGGWFGGLPWVTALTLTLLIYFYAHYAFASITTHVLALFPPFVVMLIGLGGPAAARRLQPRVPREPDGRPHPFRHDGRADRLRRRLRHGLRLVARRLSRLHHQPRHLADDRLRLVEAARLLVGLGGPGAVRHDARPAQGGACPSG